MTEVRQEANKVDSISKEQYASIGWLALRWNLYKLATNPVDFYDAAFERLDLGGNETILDIGCADGSGLLDLREKHGHKGRLIGLDINNSLFSITQQMLKGNPDNEIEFVVGSAQELPLEDKSIDISMALFMLYHVPDLDTALEEIKRVTVDDGLVAIATSGKANKARHRQFEREIAGYLGVQTAPIFSEPFNYEVASEILPQKFEIVEHFGHEDEIHIDDEDDYDAYLDSLASMKGAFSPSPSYRDFIDAAENIVEPVIFSEIEENDYFADTIDRHLFICRNTFVTE